MRRSLIQMLQGAIAAEERAAELRQAHGKGAEQACDALISERHNSAPLVEHLKDVRRALRWI